MIPVYYCCIYNEPKHNASNNEKFERFLYRRPADVVAVTAAFKSNLVVRGIDGGKIAVVINGVDLSRLTPLEWG